MEGNSGEQYAERFLKAFPSHEIYEKLDEKEDPNKCSEECSYLKSEFPKNHKIYELCCTLGKNLRDMSIIFKTPKDNIESCRYFNFWKNDQINKIYDSDETIDINYIRTKFYSISYTISSEISNEECYFMYRSGISMELWKKWKDLYDYFENKNYIQNIINSDTELCEIYPKYYTYITGIYNNYKKECCKGSNVNCPYELEFKEWCTQENILDELKCNESEEDVTHVAGHRIDKLAQPVTTDGILAKHGGAELDGTQEVFLEQRTTGVPKQQDEREDRGSLGPQGEARAVGRTERKSSPGAGILTDNGNLVLGTIDEASESILPKNTGTIGATLAGSSLFLLMMYKAHG